MGLATAILVLLSVVSISDDRTVCWKNTHPFATGVVNINIGYQNRPRLNRVMGGRHAPPDFTEHSHIILRSSCSFGLQHKMRYPMRPTFHF